MNQTNDPIYCLVFAIWIIGGVLGAWYMFTP